MSLPLLQTYHPGEEPEGLQVLEDVAGLGGDEEHVELVHGLVHVADALRLYESVLFAVPAAAAAAAASAGTRGHELGEGGQQTLDPGFGHLHELAGQQGLPAFGAHGTGQ